jgi:hypothetical protein
VAVTGSDNTFTAFINGSSVTLDATWTQAASGAAAGDVDEVNATAANQVNEGDSIKITSDGNGSSVTPTNFYVTITPR